MLRVTVCYETDTVPNSCQVEMAAQSLLAQFFAALACDRTDTRPRALTAVGDRRPSEGAGGRPRLVVPFGTARPPTCIYESGRGTT